jgi:hypothetical protein
VEGSQEEAEEEAEEDLEAVHWEVLLDALQAVPEVERREVLLALVAPADLRVALRQVRQEIPGHQKGHHLGLVRPRDFLGYKDPHPSLLDLVQVPVLAFWGDFVAVESWGFSPVDIAGGVGAMTDQPPVETIPLIHWSLL